MVESSHTAGFWPSVYEPLRSVGNRIAEWFAPASEASSSKKSYSVVMELPGVSQDDIDISLHDQTLIIKGEKHFEREETKDGSYFFSERQYGAFQRSFRLPPDASDDVTATFKDGVLTVMIARKAIQSDDTKRITINTG